MLRIRSCVVSITTIGVVLCHAGQDAPGQVILHDHFEDAQRDFVLRAPAETKPGKMNPAMYPTRTAGEMALPPAYVEKMLEFQKSECFADIAPLNDLCGDATQIMPPLPGDPTIVFGSTCGATSDAPARPCSAHTGVSDDIPGVWYSVLGTGNTMTATTCEQAHSKAWASFDTKINIYDGQLGHGPGGLVPVSGNNDDHFSGDGSCNQPPMGGAQSTATWCSEIGVEYFILVHGDRGPLDPQGDFQMVVSDDGAACSAPVRNLTVCEDDQTPEGESFCHFGYEDHTNGGCHSKPPVFGSISCGETICGFGGNYLTYPEFHLARDTDWFAMTLHTPKRVTFSTFGLGPLLLGIVDNGGMSSCDGVENFLVYDTADPFHVGSVTMDLPAGEWWFFVAPSVYFGVPCFTPYWCELQCEELPTGACCAPGGSCLQVSELACMMYNGEFLGEGTSCDDAECGGPENDLCENAITVAGNSVTSGSTVGATIDDEFPACGTTITAPGVWYHVIGTGNVMSAMTCPYANYDTKINVFCGSCEESLCVGGNDDAGSLCPESGLRSRVEWCSQIGADYYILVQGFGGATGEFDLQVAIESEDPCVADVLCLPLGACCLPDDTCVQLTSIECILAQGVYQGDDVPCGCKVVVEYEQVPCASIFEDIGHDCTILPFGDDNGDFVPIGFEFTFFDGVYTNVGVSSNGYLSFGFDLTDFDNDPIPDMQEPNNAIFPLWDDFNPSNGGSVCYATRGTAPNRRFIAQWTAVPQFGDSDSNTFQAVLFEGSNAIEYRYGAFTPEDEPGDYTIGIENVEGSDGLSVDASGVYPGDCIRYETIPVLVPNVGYFVSDCSSDFEDITGSGFELPLGDDDGDLVPLGFDFVFFDASHSQVGVSSNGYLTFGSDLTDLSNDPIPNGSDPNDIICPLWDDLNPNAGGTVHYDTLGAAPFRRFIAQWTDVPQFGRTDRNTFQAVLFEGSNAIEFRYAGFTPQESLGDYTVGVENADGSDGKSVDASTIESFDCLRFEFMDPPDPCIDPELVAVDCHVNYLELEDTETYAGALADALGEEHDVPDPVLIELKYEPVFSGCKDFPEVMFGAYLDYGCGTASIENCDRVVLFCWADNDCPMCFSVQIGGTLVVATDYAAFHVDAVDEHGNEASCWCDICGSGAPDRPFDEEEKITVPVKKLSALGGPGPGR